jgi:hypothetical protein
MGRLCIILLVIELFAASSCKHPTESLPPDGCNTCQPPCDTCHISSPNDTTSHRFTWSFYHLPTNQVQEGDVGGCWVFDRNNILINNWYLYRYDGNSINKVFLWNSEGGELSSISASKIFAFDSSDFWLGYGGAVWHIDGRRYQNELIAWITRLDQT